MSKTDPPLTRARSLDLALEEFTTARGINERFHSVRQVSKFRVREPVHGFIDDEDDGGRNLLILRCQRICRNLLLRESKLTPEASLALVLPNAELKEPIIGNKRTNPLGLGRRDSSESLRNRVDCDRLGIGKHSETPMVYLRDSYF